MEAFLPTHNFLETVLLTLRIKQTDSLAIAPPMCFCSGITLLESYCSISRHQIIIVSHSRHLQGLVSIFIFDLPLRSRPASSGLFEPDPMRPSSTRARRVPLWPLCTLLQALPVQRA